MKNSEKNSGNKIASLCIEGEMTIYRAIELKKILLDSIGQSPVLEVDLSKVSEIDTAGIQLLIFAKKNAQSKQQNMRLTAHSLAVIQVFELLNLAAYFGDPLVIQ